jgi:hypothetical protein
MTEAAKCQLNGNSSVVSAILSREGLAMKSEGAAEVLPETEMAGTEEAEARLVSEDVSPEKREEA